MTAVRFGCGHGSPRGEGVVSLSRPCPLCMLLDETHRSRKELIAKAAPPDRRAVAVETRVGAEYEWRCARGHDRYRASVRSVLTGPSCAKCIRNAASPGAAGREAGLAFMKPGLRTRTSATEQRLKIMLARRIRLHHKVNAVRTARMFYGKQEVWPDILVPQLRIAVEYDDPGRGGRAHRGLKEGSDQEKDAALNEVGWEVIRIRARGLEPLGPYSVMCQGLTEEAVDEVVRLMREIRGDAAVDALRVPEDAVAT
ncbi:hypothetical protein GCM10025877_32240 [Agromyces mangrovi Wang et al. 2018]|nr:hypothetical protein GCM10025877_32240 [Agromyces mangrovi]